MAGKSDAEHVAALVGFAKRVDKGTIGADELAAIYRAIEVLQWFQRYLAKFGPGGEP